jgi:prevent-host-death family protein
MIMKTVSKSAFKPHAFEYFRMVQAGQTIVITDHGEPVARIVPYADVAEDAAGALAGAVNAFREPLEPLGVDDWESSR